ncbi:MAG: hypothetical protein Q4C87_00675 [Actinomycetaceae bacterium]|nr:hypothetical protein [Actinomycetaceae bacterium]
MFTSRKLRRVSACGLIALGAASFVLSVQFMPAAGATPFADRTSNAIPPENLGAHRVLIKDHRVEVMVRDVVVSNGLTTVTFSLHDPRESGDPIPIGDVFTIAPKGHFPKDRSPSGVTLIDSSTGKIYYVAAGSDGQCLCSQEPSELTLHPGRTTVLSATFAALPREVKAVSVVIPIAGIYPDIPVQHRSSSNGMPIKNPIHAPISDSLFINEGGALLH